jgi:hypothetical protein
LASSPRSPRAWPRAWSRTLSRKEQMSHNRQTRRPGPKTSPEPEAERTDKQPSHGSTTEPSPNVHSRTSRGTDWPGLHEMTFVSSPCIVQPPGEFQESTKDHGTPSHIWGIRPWGETPGWPTAPPWSKELLPTGTLLLPHLQKGTVLGWPDLQDILHYSP